MDLGGLAVTLLDTAGLRNTTDQVEQLGVVLARERAEKADIRVFLTEEGVPPEVAHQTGDIVLLPKADLRNNPEGAISGTTGQGVDHLVRSLTDELTQRTAGAGLATRERHRSAMLKAGASISAALELMSGGPDRYDIAAEELRHAILALESLVGRIDVENLLDEIFSSFCIGK